MRSSQSSALGGSELASDAEWPPTPSADEAALLGERGPGPAAPTVSVAIPAYTMKRWELLRRAVESARSQTAPVEEVVVCIDNNEELLARARAEWREPGRGVRVSVIANRHSDHLEGVGVHQAAHGTTRRFGAGSARNTAAEAIRADVIAFMDDDAEAAPNWIEELLRVYADPAVVAVGGPPLPRYESARPSWFPANFDWVFGCAYEGLPTTVAPLRHLIGANMSVRRSAFEAVGGFIGSDFDDLNLCMRLAARFGERGIYYTPRAVVRHYVSDDRVTWRYFWRRCYFVNRQKVRVFEQIGSAANLTAEREFVLRALTRQTARELRRAAAGELAALSSLAAMVAGIALAAAGNARGKLDRLFAGG
ncbi:MAG TPA: glycosyltransferase family 2 protein [Solirubrobacteraceae bacterium]|nr:glycosyltransferase family 2 protein [Solirubrobacteraceae bacterium]